MPGADTVAGPMFVLMAVRRLGMKMALAGANVILGTVRTLQALGLIGPRGAIFALRASSMLTRFAMRQWRRQRL